MSKSFNVSSEINQLKKVIVHRPDEGVSRVSPKRSDELLFDDIVFLPTMQEEHDIFVSVLQAFLGEENVWDTRMLIFEALEEDEEGRKELLEKVVDFEELPLAYAKTLSDMDNTRLTRVLVSGFDKQSETVFFDPIPNFIFTRDIAVMINDHIIITKAAKTARHRENLLTRFFLWCHPHFKLMRDQGKLINLNAIEKFPPSKNGESVSIEGGDVMIINQSTLLIGTSERSTEHAFHSIKDVLFSRGVVENVVQVAVPPERSYMHIDTLFTQVDEDLFVAHKPIVLDGLSSYVKVFSRSGTERIYPSVHDFLKAEISPNVDFVMGGGGISPFQEREQWTDACNLLTVKPGVALAYDRNTHTEKEFISKGYEVIKAREFLEKIESGELDPKKIEKTIITLPSGELSRARGGSHCMSCPIDRV